MADCTNGGVSSTEQDLYLLHPNGAEITSFIKGIREDCIFKLENCGDGYIRLVPASEDRFRTSMAGGNIAMISRMDKDRAPELVGKVLHIHDRYETAAQSRSYGD